MPLLHGPVHSFNLTYWTLQELRNKKQNKPFEIKIPCLVFWILGESQVLKHTIKNNCFIAKKWKMRVKNLGLTGKKSCTCWPSPSYICPYHMMGLSLEIIRLAKTVVSNKSDDWQKIWQRRCWSVCLFILDNQTSTNYNPVCSF